MKKIFYTLIITLLTIPAFAQSSQEARTLLDNVSKAYHNKSSFYLKFNTVLNNSATGTKDSYDGEIYVKDDKYNLAVPKMDIRQIYDGFKLYTISSETKEITITKPDADSDELFTPTRVLDMYKSGYNLSMDGVRKVNAKNVTFVKLTPNNASKGLKHVLVGIDRNSHEMVQLIEVNNNNTTTTLTIEKQLSDIIVPKSILTFNKNFFKDYYISEI
ncbi:MAG: LolA-like putative outer membrane lipoprotein chaperone [Flavobacteriaceae bacterium]|nr:LolA-like putative outer membrane lipoprotein chaperone [Flavobacteriaceae bacterium]